MTLGNAIKELRLTKKYSQRKLALLSNVSNTTISRIESDSVTPDTDTLSKIANALKTDINTFISYIDSDSSLDNNVLNLSAKGNMGTELDIHNSNIEILNNATNHMFGDILKQLRTENNFTQAELSKKIQVSASTIGMYEQNRRVPDIDVLDKIATFFNVSIDYLLGRSKETKTVLTSFSLDTSSLGEESKKALEEYLKLLKLKEMQERNIKNSDGNFSTGS